MHRRQFEKIFAHYPFCRRFLAEEVWKPVAEALPKVDLPPDVPHILAGLQAELDLPPFLADLARLELLIHAVRADPVRPAAEVTGYQVNPTLQSIELPWRHLFDLVMAGDDPGGGMPESGRELILLWRQPASGELAGKVAGDEDLLVLKIILEGLSPDDVVAAAENITVGEVDRALARAVARGLILAPASLLSRDRTVFPDSCEVDRDTFMTADAFSLQWHLTQACDLHCRHCYDRSARTTMEPARALSVLDDLRDFCRSHHVRGNVSFSGGNPLLYPHFFELYRGARERGLNIAILGNPAGRETMEKIIAITPPARYQVSLEGLPEHNDYMRGAGHFGRVITFLELLRELGVYSMVMLTLTRANLAQVILLAELLRDKVDSFAFNRLTMVGEGANLQSVSPADFQAFLPEFLAAARNNPTIRLKDNLFNIIRRQNGRDLFQGCAGFGCGAAFNFLTLLPDGEVHACRKFPSPVGNIMTRSLAEIYHSPAAERYRHGSDGCRECAIRPACGGCQAVVYGMGLDSARDRDPYCFIDS